MEIKGITTVLNNKKWVFAYTITTLAFLNLDGGDLMGVLVVLIPLVIGANSFEKSKWTKKDDE